MVDDQYVNNDEIVVVRTDINSLGGRGQPHQMVKMADHLWKLEINLVSIHRSFYSMKYPTLTAFRRFLTQPFALGESCASGIFQFQ